MTQYYTYSGTTLTTTGNSTWSSTNSGSSAYISHYTSYDWYKHVELEYTCALNGKTFKKSDLKRYLPTPCEQTFLSTLVPELSYNIADLWKASDISILLIHNTRLLQVGEIWEWAVQKVLPSLWVKGSNDK